MRTALQLTTQAARWALGFYRRQFFFVFGLSLVPAAQRFLWVAHGEAQSARFALFGEILTALIRLSLIAFAIRLAAREQGMVELSWAERRTLLEAAIKRRNADFIAQFAVLAVAVGLLSGLPNLLIALWFTEPRQSLAKAVLLAIKNPTVIAFTILWLIGIARVLIAEQRSLAEDSRSERARRSPGGTL